MSREELLALVSAQAKTIEVLTERVGELERQVASDSSNSSRPPSSDAPWGQTSSSRSLADDPDELLEIHPGHCTSCDASLRGASEHGRQRRQVVDVTQAPPPTVTKYQRISKVCRCCGTVTTAGWDDPAVPVEHRPIVAAPGSPVRIGPEALARAALLTCGHYLPGGAFAAVVGGVDRD